MSMVDFYLKKRIFTAIIMFVVGVFVAIRMWRNKQVITGCLVKHRNNIFRAFYTRIIPVIFVITVSLYLAKPVMDMVAPSTYEYVGILSGVSSNNSTATGWTGEYTIKIDETTYRVPKGLVSHTSLEKGERYKVYYHPHTKLVYKIELMP